MDNTNENFWKKKYLEEVDEHLKTKIDLIGTESELRETKEFMIRVLEQLNVISIGLGFSLCFADGIVPRNKIKDEINSLDESIKEMTGFLRK